VVGRWGFAGANTRGRSVAGALWALVGVALGVVGYLILLGSLGS
jgi:hypothetical protein